MELARIKQAEINSIGEDLKAQEQESKEGEMTYDCLLKLVEDSCTRIREAQLH